jgi:hypothetical protein
MLGGGNRLTGRRSTVELCLTALLFPALGFMLTWCAFAEPAPLMTRVLFPLFDVFAFFTACDAISVLWERWSKRHGCAAARRAGRVRWEGERR